MIYLDNAATTAPDSAVLETFNSVYKSFWANPHSLHRPGERAEQLLEQSRKQVTDLLGGENYRAVFTSGATESNNLAIKGVAELYQRRGNHIITTNSEHPSVENVMCRLESQGYAVTRLPVSDSGAVTAAQVRDALTSETILISTIFVNNESGAVTPVAEIAEEVKSHQAFYHIDAVQGIGKLPFSLSDAPVDLLSLSAHKFFGLKGSGVLVLRDNLALTPQLLGGGQEFGLRSGTADVPRAASFAKALRLAVDGIETKLAHVKELNLILRDKISDFPRVVCNSPQSASPYILNLSVSGIRPETILHGLSDQEIYISTVSACSSKKAEYSPIILALTGDEIRSHHSIRISLSHQTMRTEIDSFIEHFSRIINQLQ